MKDDIKNLIVFSLIFGASAGLAALIPMFGVLVFLLIIFCSSFIIISFMKKMGYLFCPNEQTGLLYGAISGFTAFIGYVIIFLPCSFVLSLVFKASYYTGIGMIMKSGFSLCITLIVFIGILSALMNAFSGLASIYFFNSNRDANQEKFTLDINKGKK